MSFWSAIIAEASDDRTLFLLLGLIPSLLVGRRSADAQRRARAIVLFCVFHVLLMVIAGVMRAIGSEVYVEVRLACLIFAAVAGVGMANLLLSAAMQRLPRASRPGIKQDVIFACVLFFSVLSMASKLGFNLSGLIATSAVITAVIGFALQDTLGNVAAGLALQVDNSIEVGDWIRVGELTGRVTEIRWRYTAVETRNWETAIIPNSLLTKNQVLVLGRREGQPRQWRRWIHFNVDFRYPPSEVLQAVTDALHTAALQNVAREPPPHCVLMELHDSYGRYALRYWLTDLAVDDPTDSEMRTLLYFALKRAGIPLSIPAQALFVTEESAHRQAEKGRRDLDNRVSALSRIDLFSPLSEEERLELARSLRHAPFARGEVITRQGAEAHWLYLIMRGEASVRVGSDGGLEREVARLLGGNFFGEMSLLTGARRLATVVALTDVDCYRLDKGAFQEIIRRRPEIAEHAAAILAQRNVELLAAKENLDQEARSRRLTAAKLDFLGKIRDFFGLSSEGRLQLGESAGLSAGPDKRSTGT